jgi:hypothetical protein
MSPELEKLLEALYEKFNSTGGKGPSGRQL